MDRVLIFVTVAATVSLFPGATGAGGFTPHHPDRALYAATARADATVAVTLDNGATMFGGLRTSPAADRP